MKMRTRTEMLAAFLAVSVLAVAQSPKPKYTKAEAEAVNGFLAEKDPAAKIAKIEAFVQKFADTQFKAMAYTQAARAAEQMNAGSKVVIYSDLAIEADPKAYEAMLMESAELARTTRENDLDKDEKLGKSEKLAHEAMEIIPTVPKPNPQIPDEQWEEAKREFLGDAHRDLGMIATVRKKYDVSIAEFKQAVEIPHEADAPTYIRLAAAYNDNRQPDEALATLAKMPANPQLAPFADREKKRAEALKAAKK
jgi:tetratricopeptide (TPR) repeat protein